MSPDHPWFDDSDEGPDDDFDNGSDDEQHPEDSGFGAAESDTIRCPECGADIFDDAIQCPHCGHYIEADTSPWSGRSLWWIVLGALGVIAAVAALIGLAHW